MKNPLQVSAVLVLAMGSLVACLTPVAEKPDLSEVWPDVVRAIFQTETEAPYLIVLLPEDGRTTGSDFPVLIVPAGSAGFDRFTPLAFLPGDKPQPPDPAPGPAAPDGPEDGNDADVDNLEQGADELEAEDDDEGSPFDDWPPVSEAEWPPNLPVWPPPLTGPPTEDDIDEMLDDALRRAFEDEEPTPPEDEEPTPPEDEDEHPLEDRFWTPVIPPNLPRWWDPPEVPDLSPEPDDGLDLHDFSMPRWTDVDPDMLPPPGWPGGEPWPLDDGFRLPERWRLADGGLRLGGWRIYIVPLPSDGN